MGSQEYFSEHLHLCAQGKIHVLAHRQFLLVQPREGPCVISGVRDVPAEDVFCPKSIVQKGNVGFIQGVLEQ